MKENCNYKCRGNDVAIQCEIHNPQPSDCVYCNFDLEFTGDPGRKIFKWHLDRHGMKEVTEPEEWSARFEKKFVYKGIPGYELRHHQMCEDLQDFIREEIRKAEERGYDKGWDDNVKRQQSWMKRRHI